MTTIDFSIAQLITADSAAKPGQIVWRVFVAEIKQRKEPTIQLALDALIHWTNQFVFMLLDILGTTDLSPAEWQVYPVPQWFHWFWFLMSIPYRLWPREQCVIVNRTTTTREKIHIFERMGASPSDRGGSVVGPVLRLFHEITLMWPHRAHGTRNDIKRVLIKVEAQKNNKKRADFQILERLDHPIRIEQR